MAQGEEIGMIPKYMQRGSRGPHVTILQVFLVAKGVGEGILFDLDYGNKTAAAVVAYQKSMGIDADGNCGPQTRATMREADGFDFEAACESVPGRTEFVQPEGAIALWAPGEVA